MRGNITVKSRVLPTTIAWTRRNLEEIIIAVLIREDNDAWPGDGPKHNHPP